MEGSSIADTLVFYQNIMIQCLGTLTCTYQLVGLADDWLIVLHITLLLTLQLQGLETNNALNTSTVTLVSEERLGHTRDILLAAACIEITIALL